MDTRLGIAGVLVLLAAGVAPAQADIYTWIDASGTVNYSDTPPPRGARVTGIVHDSPAPAFTPMEAEAAREAAHRAEMDALNARIQLLERELDLANRPAPAPAQYVTAPPPSPPLSSCAYWGDCGSWWSPAFFAPPVVVVEPHHFHHFDHDRGFHHWDAGRSGGGFMRR